MYLKLNQGSKEQHLRNINQLTLKIFEYTAQAATFDKEEFEQFVKDDEVWSTKAYRPGNPFYSNIENLFSFPQKERERIYRVIQHDMEFDQHITDPDFVFKEHQLSDRQREIAKKLIFYLYDNLFREGKFMFRDQEAGYQEVKDSLFEQNLSNICPACLAWQTDLKDYGEVDHYFPTKSYPALIFHPVNLTVICSECNGLLVKGERDAFETGNLTELYIPYLRHAEEEVKLEVRLVEEGDKDGEKKTVKKMMMVPRESDVDELINNRIQNLDNLFDLSKRWTKRMNTVIEKELEDLKDEKKKYKAKRLLHDRVKDYKRQAAGDKTKLLEATTLEYMENENKKSFFAEWCMRRKEQKVMSEFNANT